MSPRVISKTHACRTRGLRGYTLRAFNLWLVCTVLCQWCSKWEHRLCAGVSAKEYDLLSNSCSKIMFFCSLCCPKVPLALKIDDANHSVSSNYETLREAITDLAIYSN